MMTLDEVHEEIMAHARRLSILGTQTGTRLAEILYDTGLRLNAAVVSDRKGLL